MNDIVKEVEKAEKLLGIIRDLENRDLSDQDRLTLKSVQEKLMERGLLEVLRVIRDLDLLIKPYLWNK